MDKYRVIPKFNGICLVMMGLATVFVLFYGVCEGYKKLTIFFMSLSNFSLYLCYVKYDNSIH